MGPYLNSTDRLLSILALEKERQCLDWDAVRETGSFTVKFSELEWKLRRSWMDYVRIIKSFRSKMEEGSLALITFSVSLFLPLSAAHSSSLSFYFTHSVVCTDELLPLLVSAIIIFCEFPMWQCGTVPA